jgi:hypothetical protein
MPWASGSQPAPTWFYTRGADSVRIEVRDHGSAFELVVCGPGARERSQECVDAWAVIECQIAEETHLMALGYTLERFTSDLRDADNGSWRRPVRVGKIPPPAKERASDPRA